MWETTYDEGISDVSSQLIQTTDGNYTIVGYTNADNTSRTDVNSKELLLLKINADGGLVWRKTYNIGLSTSTDKSIVQTSDGGYVFTYNTSPVSVSSTQWVWTQGAATAIKTDSEGAIEWIQTYNNASSPMLPNGASPALNSVIQTSDGGLAFCWSLRLSTDMDS